MKVTIQPSLLKGTVRAPASKSSMQRALAAALLTKGTSRIHNPGRSHDDKATLKVIEDLGAKIKYGKNEIIIESSGVNPVTDEVNCGESGLGIRMITPIVALSKKEITIHGEGSLLNRPMDFFDEILTKLAVKVKSNHGKLPVVIQGPLQPADIVVDGSVSSQFITGLLMAYGAADARDVTVKVIHLKSKPYISLTLDVMKQFGLKVPVNKNYEEFVFDDSAAGSRITSSLNQPKTSPAPGYTVEGDWSGGAFLLVAGAIAGPITVGGLDLTSSQPDKAIVDVLIAARAGIAIEAKGIKIRPAEMIAFDFDATDCPDLFPPLVALAAYCNGDTTIKGTSRLISKESNRALTLQEEFCKMGVKIECRDDGMIIRGGMGVKGARVHSHHDHRVAMACAVAGLGAAGETIIEEAGAVKKSYPGFYNDLKLLGAAVSLPNQQFNL